MATSPIKIFYNLQPQVTAALKWDSDALQISNVQLAITIYALR